MTLQCEQTTTTITGTSISTDLAANGSDLFALALTRGLPQSSAAAAVLVVIPFPPFPSLSSLEYHRKLVVV